MRGWDLVGVFYFPLVFTAVIGFLRGRQKHMFAACLLGALWVAVSLPALALIAAWAGWWSYEFVGPRFAGMPLGLYFGWIVWWGILPQIVLDGLSVPWSAVLLVALDLPLMPLVPMVNLPHRWLIGEAVAVLTILLPALWLARWTLTQTHLRLRAALQVALSGGLFLLFLPELVFALRPGRGWAPLLAMPGWESQIALQVIAILAVPGVGAVMEFAERGGGTPIPYDPPQLLVTSGIYRYCANPMQLSCALVMLAWAAVLRNGWLVRAAAISVVYSAGLANWDESQDLEKRFGETWADYRRAVTNWVPRWRPYHAGAHARLYIAASCAPCIQLRAWLEARRPAGIEIIDAETLPQGSIRRMRYDAADGSGPLEGVRAMGRALEHLNLGWALAGTALRFPILWQCAQLLMDVSGLGPREACAYAEPEAKAQPD